LESDTKGVTGLTGRYASALFELADESNVLDRVAEDLSVVVRLIEANNDLDRLLRSPIIPRIEQGAAMEAILEKAGASELTRKFVGLTSSNRRLFVLREIIRDYLLILSNRRGEVIAEVTSAEPLSDQQTSEILKVFKAALGEKVNLTTRLDASILGGLVVKIGSRMIDSSLKNKLQKLRLALRGVG